MSATATKKRVKLSQASGFGGVWGGGGTGGLGGVEGEEIEAGLGEGRGHHHEVVLAQTQLELVLVQFLEKRFGAEAIEHGLVVVGHGLLKEVHLHGELLQ